MNTAAKQPLPMSAIAAELAAMSLVLLYGALLFAPLYWGTVVNLVLGLPYPDAYAYLLQAVTAGVTGLAIFVMWMRGKARGYPQELLLAYVLSWIFVVQALVALWMRPGLVGVVHT